MSYYYNIKSQSSIFDNSFINNSITVGSSQTGTISCSATGLYFTNTLDVNGDIYCKTLYGNLANGLTGPIGPQGFQGFIGNTGPQGFQGFQGFIGNTGPQGIPGSAIGAIYYFNESDSSDIPNYSVMSRIINIGSGTSITVSGAGTQQAGTGFVSPIGDPSLNVISAGTWTFSMYASLNANGGLPTLYASASLLHTGGSETLLGNNSLNPVIIYNGLITTLYNFTVPIAQTSCITTDRLLVRFYAGNLGGKTMSVYFQGAYFGQVLTSLSAQQGFQGFQGFIGPTGVQGPQGFQGFIGNTGPQGPIASVAGSSSQIIFNQSGSYTGSNNLTFNTDSSSLITNYLTGGTGSFTNLSVQDTLNIGSTNIGHIFFSTGNYTGCFIDHLRYNATGTHYLYYNGTNNEVIQSAPYYFFSYNTTTQIFTGTNTFYPIGFTYSNILFNTFEHSTGSSIFTGTFGGNAVLDFTYSLQINSTSNSKQIAAAVLYLDDNPITGSYRSCSVIDTTGEYTLTNSLLVNIPSGGHTIQLQAAVTDTNVELGGIPAITAPGNSFTSVNLKCTRVI